MDKRSQMHPGEVLFEGYMKPRGMSQYRLAQEIGVPPIRVSEIVRGKRAISADTALRLARFFDDTDEHLWMDLQRRYDLEIEKGKIGEGLAKVRPFAGTLSGTRAGGPVPLRTLVNATDLVEWANRRDAQGLLPKVIRSLVLATVGNIERIAFSSEEGVQLGGWDGIIEVPEGNAFVPRGLSAWELGTNRDVKRKADEDYEKRTEDPLGLDPSETIFVFVTPRRWSKKTEWVASRQAEGIWSEVRVYDADDLETWLEFAPGVHIWLSTIAGKHPEGTSDLRTYWEGWAGVTDPPMSAELVISGRREGTERILTWLRGQPSSLGLRAESKEEALAFFAATLYQMDPTEREMYFARSLVVDDVTAWRQLSGFGEGLVLVPTFDVRDADVAPAGHHTLIPLGKSEGYRSRTTEELPRPRREDVKEALQEMKLSTERLEDLATLARRSLMALRRKLAVKPPIKRPEWAAPAEARALLPAMLVGAWESTNAGDREVVATLAKKPYGDVESDLARWSNESDPPVRKVGDAWLIASKEDAWGLLAGFLTRDDLDVFSDVVLGVLGELDPSYAMAADQRWSAAIYGKSLPHSGLLREGLAETLALMGARSETPTFSTTNSGQERANAIVRELLDKANEDWRLWASLSGLLPLLAESAPEVFLDAVARGVSGDRPVLVNLFSDADTGLFGSSPHTGLLWALEVLAWNPDHLGYASRMLAKLASLDPGGRLMNRPQRSLQEIFLCWHPQTKASLEKRLRILDAIKRREPKVYWRLLRGILPELHGTALSTASPRWRDWAPDEPPKITYSEIWAAVSEVVERLLEDVGTDGERWRDLIEKIGDLPKEQQDAIVEKLLRVDIRSFAPEDRLAVRDALRSKISRHREFPDAHWAMPGEQVDRLQQAYERFEPNDPVSRHAWLFSTRPDLLEPSGREWLVRRGNLEAARLAAAREVRARGGLDLLLDLAAAAEQPGELGAALGMSDLLTDEEEDRLLSEGLGSSDSSRSELARRFVFTRARTRGWRWADEKLSGAAASTWSAEQRAGFFEGLPFASHAWDRLDATGDEEARRLYWSLTRQYGLENPADCVRAAREFVEHGRPYTAAHLVDLYLQDEEADVSPEMIASILERAVRTAPEENMHRSLFEHHVPELLDYLEASGEIEESRIAMLEWAFLPLFGHHGRMPRVLHRELSRDPAFFAEVIALVYKAEDEEQRELSEEDQNLARLAYELLSTWQSVPGLKEDGSVDPDVLRSWVDKAREANRTASRGTVGDHRIGQVLAFAPPDADGIWPDTAVRDLIDDLGDQEIENGIEIGIYNKRGVFSKSLTEGGAQERRLAQTYRGYAEELNDGWPRTAAMLRRISDVYASEARREDVKAELREDLWR